MDDDAGDCAGPFPPFDLGAASMSDSCVIDHSMFVNFDKHAVSP